MIVGGGEGDEIAKKTTSVCAANRFLWRHVRRSERPTNTKYTAGSQTGHVHVRQTVFFIDLKAFRILPSSVHFVFSDRENFHIEHIAPFLENERSSA